MDDFDDNASDLSLPEISRRTFGKENIGRDNVDQERDHERVRIQRRFNGLNRPIGELTSLVRTLNEKISSSNREENGNNSPRGRSTSHSDTRVPINIPLYIRHRMKLPFRISVSPSERLLPRLMSLEGFHKPSYWMKKMIQINTSRS